MIHEQFTVRDVCEQDIEHLLKIEQKVWGGLGTPMLSREDLEKWFITDSPFFMVAVNSRGEIGGFYYGQLNNFSLDAVDEYTSPRVLDRNGYTKHIHDPNGNSVYGLCVVSAEKGAGAALNKEVYVRVHELKKDFYFGYSRLSGFAKYLQSLSELGSYSDNELALWYAYGCITLIGGNVWEDYCAPCPVLELPAPTEPDPVLTFHVKGTGFDLLRVVPDFMKDPQSKGYATFHAYDARAAK